MFSQNLVLWVSWNRLSTGRDAGRGKVAYIWISSDPAKVGPTLGGNGVVVYSGLINENTVVNLIVIVYQFALKENVSKSSLKRLPIGSCGG